MDYFYGWKPYVSVAARRAQATQALSRLRKKGGETSPVQIDGRKIATTFWGKAWCDNLERYSDFANRLPRGRSYVRNGSVIDLQVAGGQVTALVSGSDVYEIRIGVTTVNQNRWRNICRDCTGAIDSLIELLQGRLSTQVMTRICEPTSGLFPEPRELSFQCSCPDWASMCKHVAATLYGIGARLDERPELLFLLRGVDQQELVAKAGTGLQPAARASRSSKVIESADLSAIFGIDIAAADVPTPAPPPRRSRTPRSAGEPAAKKRTTRAAEKAGKKAKPAARAAAPPKRKAMTQKQRESVAERMKKYWRERRRKAR